jgi:two-component system cell cycle response regulator
VASDMKILLAEDSPVYQRLIAGYLKQWGFSLELAGDGAEAWKLLGRPDSPSLALLDWVLPGMNGIDLCRNIRNRGTKERYIYTVLLTGKTEKQDLVSAMEAGADDYLVKPFIAEELRARLLAGKRILDLHQELLSAQQSLQFAATHDFLTSLWNRAEIMAFLHRELERGQREKRPVGVALLDIDHFKAINDSLGHRSGDHVLKELARRLRAQLRSYDGLGRYGGEEFLLVLPGCDLETTIDRLDAIQRSIARATFPTHPGTATVTVSMGATVSHGIGVTECESLLQEADIALYRAKQAGRNCVQHCPA